MLFSVFIEKAASVTGLREIRDETLATLHEHNYDFITANNIEDFGYFMDAVRAAAETLRYDSERVAELYEWGEKTGVPVSNLIKHFEDYMEMK